jgi:hypothetical protein
LKNLKEGETFSWIFEKKQQQKMVKKLKKGESLFSLKYLYFYEFFV